MAVSPAKRNVMFCAAIAQAAPLHAQHQLRRLPLLFGQEPVVRDALVERIARSTGSTMAGESAAARVEEAAQAKSAPAG